MLSSNIYTNQSFSCSQSQCSSFRSLLKNRCRQVVSATLLTSCSFIATSASTDVNTVNPYQEDIKLLKAVLSDVHPGYTRYQTSEQLSDSWQTLSKESVNASPLEFYAAVSKMIATLKCEHTKADLPKTLSDQKKSRMMPFTFRIFDNQMYVHNSQNGLPKGAIVTSIQGVKVADIISKLLPYVAVDGYVDYTKIAALELDMDLIGSNFEQFFSPVVLGQSEYAEFFDVEYSVDGVSTMERFDAISLKEWQVLAERPYRLNFKDAVELTYRDDVAILKVDTFVNYRVPVDADALFEKLFTEINNRNVSKLIVDLRNNGGGSQDAQMALLSHLYSVPFQLDDKAWTADTDLTEWEGTLTTWDDRIFSSALNFFPSDDVGRRIPAMFLGDSYSKQKPAKQHFKGEIVMLTSVRNASASAGLLAHIKQQPNVTLIGEKTGGNQGGTTATIMGFLKLPTSGVTVRVPFIRNSHFIVDAKDGYGVTPDIIASQSLQDWLEDKDTALLVALGEDQNEVNESSNASTAVTQIASVD